MSWAKCHPDDLMQYVLAHPDTQTLTKIFDNCGEDCCKPGHLLHDPRTIRLTLECPHPLVEKYLAQHGDNNFLIQTISRLQSEGDEIIRLLLDRAHQWKNPYVLESFYLNGQWALFSAAYQAGARFGASSIADRYRAGIFLDWKNSPRAKSIPADIVFLIRPYLYEVTSYGHTP